MSALIKYYDDKIEELELRCRILDRRIIAYQQTVNHIDDFFEYTNKSKSDREFIHAQLESLTTKLEKTK